MPELRVAGERIEEEEREKTTEKHFPLYLCMCTIITEEEGNYIDTHKCWYGFSFKTRIKLKETCKKRRNNTGTCMQIKKIA